MKTILMVLSPENFRDVEYIVPRAFWLQKGAKIMTTSSVPLSKGRFGYEVKHDFLFTEVSSKNFDGIFFVGGGGSLALAKNADAKRLTLDFFSVNKPIGAICAASRNFLEWGILRGKKCTGHNWDGKLPDLCEQYEAKYENEKVVVDGGICTGSGPDAAEETALAFWELLFQEPEIRSR